MKTKKATRKTAKPKPAQRSRIIEEAPAFVPDFAYASIQTTMRLTTAKRDVSVTIDCLPTASKADPAYHVTIDQTDLLAGMAIHDRNKPYNIPLDLLALGIQSGETQFRWNGLRKSGKIRLTYVDPGVQLGRPKSSGWEWVDARAYQTAADKLHGEIEPWDGPRSKGPYVFVRFNADKASFTVVHVQGRLRHDTIWRNQPKRGKRGHLYPDGSNVPPPIPPGSSVGD